MACRLLSAASRARDGAGATLGGAIGSAFVFAYRLKTGRAFELLAVEPRLTPVQREVFAALGSDGPVSVNELRRRTGRSRGSVTSALMMLQSKGVAGRVKWGEGRGVSSEWARAA